MKQCQHNNDRWKCSEVKCSGQTTWLYHERGLSTAPADFREALLSKRGISLLTTSVSILHPVWPIFAGMTALWNENTSFPSPYLNLFSLGEIDTLFLSQSLNFCSEKAIAPHTQFWYMQCQLQQHPMLPPLEFHDLKVC